jgi:hypothetical protein
MTVEDVEAVCIPIVTAMGLDPAAFDRAGDLNPAAGLDHPGAWYYEHENNTGEPKHEKQSEEGEGRQKITAQKAPPPIRMKISGINMNGIIIRDS